MGIAQAKFTLGFSPPDRGEAASDKFASALVNKTLSKILFNMLKIVYYHHTSHSFKLDRSNREVLSDYPYYYSQWCRIPTRDEPHVTKGAFPIRFRITFNEVP